MGDQQHTANLAAIDSGVVPLSPVDPSSSIPSIANHQTITNETPIDAKDSIEPIRPVSPTLRVTESISSPEQPKKEKSGLVLANWVPDEAVTECSSCKRTFSALLLRFKHHCRLCGQVFCGSCTKMLTLTLPDMPSEILVCHQCHETGSKRQEKEMKRLERREQAKREQAQLNDLFADLHKAYESSDEAKAIELKESIDKLKKNIIKREQSRLAKKEEKRKKKEEEMAAKKKPKAKKTNSGIAKTPSNAEKSDTNSKKTEKKDSPKPSKPLDTPETIRAKLEQRYLLEPGKLLNPPSGNGKCCLVLDIDYTLFDHRWHQQVKDELQHDKSLIPEFKRPYLHEFLETCYTKYDLIIWSATGMTAIDSKMSNLGCYSSDKYKITAVFSKDHMIHVTKARKSGKTYEETVKPLSVVWNKFPEFYNSKNTIHIDDLATNFQLNLGNGLQIQPFKEASKNSPDDTELLYLTKYLLLIADTEPNFATLNHNKWKEYIISKLWQQQSQYSLPAHNNDTRIDQNKLATDEEIELRKKGPIKAAKKAGATKPASAPASPPLSPPMSPPPPRSQDDIKVLPENDLKNNIDDSASSPTKEDELSINNQKDKTTLDQSNVVDSIGSIINSEANNKSGSIVEVTLEQPTSTNTPPHSPSALRAASPTAPTNGSPASPSTAPRVWVKSTPSQKATALATSPSGGSIAIQAPEPIQSIQTNGEAEESNP